MNIRIHFDEQHLKKKNMVLLESKNMKVKTFGLSASKNTWYYCFQQRFKLSISISDQFILVTVKMGGKKM